MTLAQIGNLSALALIIILIALSHYQLRQLRTARQVTAHYAVTAVESAIRAYAAACAVQVMTTSPVPLAYDPPSDESVHEAALAAVFEDQGAVPYVYGTLRPAHRAPSGVE